MNCELISVGTEILLGDILNTNAQYLSKQLALLGVSVMHQCTVGDNKERLLSSLDSAFKRNDAVILTGGLGPTPDDLTKEVCAEFFSKALLLDKGILSDIEKYFLNKNIVMPESNKKQALVIEDSIVLRNKNGTAPGFILEENGKALIILPGPPKEMQPMFEEYVKPYFKSKTHEVILSHNIRTFGIGESVMAEKVADLLESSNPTVAPYAKSGESLLRVTAKAENEEKAEKLLSETIEIIKARLGDYIYGIDCDSIEQVVVSMLKERHQTVAFAESCTGGLCSKRITDISGASDVFHCSVVSYSNDIKHSVLGVSEYLLEKYTAVSEEVAMQMAEGVKKLAGADYGVSVTGYAGPGDDPLVGTIYICVHSDKKTRVKKLVTAHKGNNCRDYNRHVAASNAFDLLRYSILEDS